MERKNGSFKVKKGMVEPVVCVEDDGQGILEGKLESILKTDTKRGIGLWNIDQRLKRLFGIDLESLITEKYTRRYIL